MTQLKGGPPALSVGTLLRHLGFIDLPRLRHCVGTVERGGCLVASTAPCRFLHRDWLAIEEEYRCLTKKIDFLVVCETCPRSGSPIVPNRASQLLIHCRIIPSRCNAIQTLLQRNSNNHKGMCVSELSCIRRDKTGCRGIWRDISGKITPKLRKIRPPFCVIGLQRGADQP